jgi:glycosyltransferase involved in cell wall biosynthesis
LHYEWDDWEEKIWYHSNRTSMHTFIFGNFIKLLERLLPVVADTVSVASRKLEELCISFKVEKENLFKAPVGADLKRFSPHVSGERVRKRYRLENRKLILYLGQLHAGQYVKMFIEAAALVIRKHPDATFLIIGEGFMANQLKYFVKECNIESNVIFTGSVPHDAIPQHIAAADVCVASFEDNEVTICKSPLKIV